MSKGGGASVQALGFLTVLEHPQHGLFGGYLLLNLSGRPLEFHCTTPIKPNRAQQILYGPTLGPYLYGEQIGQTLVAKSSSRPLAVYTDLPAVMAVREHIDLPVGLVSTESEAGQGTSTLELQFRLDGPQSIAAPAALKVGRNQVTVSASFVEDHGVISKHLAELPDHFDLFEPFGRIREAIEEAGGGK